MSIETMTKLATFLLCIGVASITLGVFVNWIFIVFGIFELIGFELLSVYVHEWRVEQEEEKY
jgi:hypothetical protein